MTTATLALGQQLLDGVRGDRTDGGRIPRHRVVRDLLVRRNCVSKFQLRLRLERSSCVRAVPAVRFDS